MVNLGDKVRDKISGFEGIATGRTEYLYKCVHILVSHDKLDKDGKIPDGFWLDEDRLEVLERGRIKAKNTDRTGSMVSLSK